MRSPSFRQTAKTLSVLGAALAFLAAGAGASARTNGGTNLTVVGYTSPSALRSAVAAAGGRVVRDLPSIQAAVVETPAGVPKLTADVPGIRYAQSPNLRYSLVDPGVAAQPVPGGAYEWQYAASHEDQVPASVLQAASSYTIAVVDTGADVTAPDLAAKQPATWSILKNSTDVSDYNGHGTFVSSLAAGSYTNAEGIAGFGGDAKLLDVQAIGVGGTLTDVQSAAGIVYAVDHGANIINLSYGGNGKSLIEQNAIGYAAGHGVLVVAAAGNDGDSDPTYPAAFLQPPTSNGQGGLGLSVASTDISGNPSWFSNYGSYISLAAPGENVFGAISTNASPSIWPATALPGSSAGLYGYNDGTSFSTPEVAGAAALVWAANPQLSATDVAAVLKETATGNNGTWNVNTGWGRLDVAAAVARAQALVNGPPATLLTGAVKGAHVDLAWSAPNASSYELVVSRDSGVERVLQGATTDTSASYDLEPGHTYSFRVYSPDSYGLMRSSAPYVVSLPQSDATLTLRASRSGRGGRATVRLWASLKPADAPTPRGGRKVLLESYDGFHWRPFATPATTNSTGLAQWSVVFPRGTFLVRARFAGTLDLAAATSAGVRFGIR
jgi:subtilisin family serine protease